MKIRVFWAWVIALAVMVGGCQKSQVSQEVLLKEVQAVTAAYQEALRKDLQSGKTIDAAKQQHDEALKAVKSKHQGVLVDCLLVVEARNAEVTELMIRHELATPGFLAAIQWQSLAKEKDYEKRMSVIREFLTLNEQFYQVTGEYEALVLAELAPVKPECKEKQAFIGGFRQQVAKTYPLTEVVRKCDVDCAKTCLAIVQQLQGLDGKWNWDEKDQVVAFNDEAEAVKFQEGLKKLQQYGKAQSVAQKELANLLAK